MAFLALIVAILLIVGSFDIYVNFRAQREIIASKQQLMAHKAADKVASFIEEKFRMLEATIRIGDLASASKTDQKKVLAKLLGLQHAAREPREPPQALLPRAAL